MPGGRWSLILVTVVFLALLLAVGSKAVEADGCRNTGSEPTLHASREVAVVLESFVSGPICLKDAFIHQYIVEKLRVSPTMRMTVEIHERDDGVAHEASINFHGRGVSL